MILRLFFLCFGLLLGCSAAGCGRGKVVTVPHSTPRYQLKASMYEIHERDIGELQGILKELGCIRDSQRCTVHIDPKGRLMVEVRY